MSVTGRSYRSNGNRSLLRVRLSRDAVPLVGQGGLCRNCRNCGWNATSSTFRYRAEAPFAPVPLASNAISDSGTVKCEKPQCKQIKSFGNTQTPGLSRFLRSECATSAVNSASLPDPHDRQDISATQGNRLLGAGNGGPGQFTIFRPVAA
jgi:hypothetical protein